MCEPSHPISVQIDEERKIERDPRILQSPLRLSDDNILSSKAAKKSFSRSQPEEETEEDEQDQIKALSELTYKSKFNEVEKLIPYGLTFDDVLMIPQYSTLDSRSQASLETRFSRNVSLKLPFVSSPMDTVTESVMAVAMARQGGIGIIHRFMSIEEQAAKVMEVKQNEGNLIPYPLCVHTHTPISKVKELINNWKFSTYLVVEEKESSWIPFNYPLKKNEQPTLAGILTRRDIASAEDSNQLVKDLMTPREKMLNLENITVENMPTPEEIIKKMKDKRVEKIVLLGRTHDIISLVCLKDCERNEKRPNSNLDEFGRLRVGAAIGAKDDYLLRAEKLIEAGVDVLVVDVANGHSKLCIDAVKELKKKFPRTDIVAGSVATGEGAEMLIQAGADGIRCGIGNGSICITRVVAGAGIPQLSALFDVAPVCKKYDIPLISDGGNRCSGNMCKALAVGADCIMLGRLVAGCEESPSQIFYRDGKLVKVYRGMAGFGANAAKSQRTGVPEPKSKSFTPEGVEGYIPYAGPVFDVLNSFAQGIQSGMSYSGARSITELQKKVKFIRMTQSGFRESGVHDITKFS